MKISEHIVYIYSLETERYYNHDNNSKMKKIAELRSSELFRRRTRSVHPRSGTTVPSPTKNWFGLQKKTMCEPALRVLYTPTQHRYVHVCIHLHSCICISLKNIYNIFT